MRREIALSILLLIVAAIVGYFLVVDPPNSHKPAPTPTPVSSR